MAKSPGRKDAGSESGVGMETLFQWEWVIIELLVLAIAFWELYSVRRSLKRDRARAAEAGSPADRPPAA